MVCFFYPLQEKNTENKNYFYAYGIDKESQNEKLRDFIKGDLESFRKKYQDFKFDTIPGTFSGAVKNAILYSFSNLSDRYKEEVLYMETDDNFIIFSFAAMTKVDYEKYQPVFDKFISSFNYRGNDPQPFLEFMKKNQN